jgi:hypothetical protein
MYRATATLILFIAILSTTAQIAGTLGARAAAQDVPTVTIGTPQIAEEPSLAPPETATSVPTATATLDFAPTATSTTAAASTPEPTATPDLPIEGPVPTIETTAEATATQSPVPTVDAPIAQPVPTLHAAPGSSEAPLMLSVVAKEVSFGKISATGKLDPSITGLSSSTDDRGAFYVLSGAVAMTVSAGIPWTGACEAQENAGTAATVAIAAGRLEWRLVGTTTWTSFPPSISDTSCFPSPDVGTRTFGYDLRLRVETDDPPGSFSTVIVFTVEP